MGTALTVLFALVIAPVLSPAAGATPADPGATAAIGNVRHEPVTPKPGVTVLVTARLTHGVTKPVLRLQGVAPGKYVRKSDPGYEYDWTDLPMRGDGVPSPPATWVQWRVIAGVDEVSAPSSTTTACRSRPRGTRSG